MQQTGGDARSVIENTALIVLLVEQFQRKLAIIYMLLTINILTNARTKRSFIS